MTFSDVLATQAKYRAVYAKAIDEERAMIAAASAEKSRLPDNYWQGRHVAGRKLDVVNAVVEALREA